jgi:hypothetical protein
VLLPEEPDTIDHLLSSFARGSESLGQAGVLSLQGLDALGRDDALHSRRLETLQPRLGLKRATAKRCQLVAKMFDELLQLRKGGSFRSYAV